MDAGKIAESSENGRVFFFFNLSYIDESTDDIEPLLMKQSLMIDLNSSPPSNFTIASRPRPFDNRSSAGSVLSCE